MTCELISVGTELLLGNILNTNAQYISQKLADLGVNCYLQTTVGDNPDRLEEAVRRALARADVVILTGGLGPTCDDLTKETVSAALGKKLVLDEDSLAHIRRRFAKMGREMTPNNVKQAEFPEGCAILPNPHGTAPGCIIEHDGKAAILLPGPPNEMEPMFDASVMPYLEKRSGTKLYSRMVRIFGKGESSVEYELRDLMDGTNPTVAPYALLGEVKLRVTARCRSEREGEKLVAPVIAEIRRRLGAVVYSDEGRELHEVCAELLLGHKKTLAVAESCTGGMLASRLVSVPGSSRWFLEGCVTYANDAKARRLGVSTDTLASCGAVSGQTALEMARGIRRTSGADVGLAITGIAGPDGGTPEKPVGLVYIALASGEVEQVTELRFTGGRERIRNSACLNALDMLRRSF
ncbi:MAG: putative competence-damage inducible protein [Firmicutes bacterium ADurb.Bin248]|nr:MAG: putative competence-damage inducible protein [Firmicutes bacterium ADurb.Bin248]HOG00328.1 competence/damage-inducible protein A [Clostridia bacterium]HPK14997.1 competence/damage-inducible protein A [Clostridia bacterium]